MNDDTSISRLSLQQILDFTWEDLAENRAGRLSERQQQRLSGQYRRNSLLLAMLVAVMILLYFLYLNLQIDQKTVIIPIGIGLIFGICLFMLQFVQFFVDARRGIVKSVRGEARYVRSGKNSVATHLKIEEIPILVDIVGGFEEGKPYLVYYAPWSKNAMSAEALESE
jgi:hypothetical protein